MSEIEENIQKLHRATYYENLNVPGQERDEPFPRYLAEVRDENSLIFLPDASDFRPSQTDLVAILRQRATVRHYDTQAELTATELAFLLKYTQGIREFNQKRKVTLRYVPSAGSRHPFETYLLIQRVSGLLPGLYHFIAHKNALEILSLKRDPIQRAHECALRQRQVITSAVTFFWSAEIYRASWRYSERAYRYFHLDAGHICQNLYLCAESIGCGVCAIAAFDDQLANNLFDQKEAERFITYIASVGKKIDG